MFDIITIGTATRDVFLSNPLFNIVRDPQHLKKIGIPTGEAQCFALGGKIEIAKPVFTTGGGAGNTAITFSRQGLKTATLVKLGKDESAKAILEEFKREKITPFVVSSENASTAYSIILLASGGERTILVYRGASENLKIKEIPFGQLKTRWAYIAPGKIPFETIKEIFEYFIKNRTLIAFNPSDYFLKMGIKKLKTLLNKSKVVILNREEAAGLVGVDYQKEKEIFKKFDKIVGGITVMTGDKKGVLVSDCCSIYQAGVFREKKIIDRTGAGDAFGSGFIAGLIHKKEKCKKGLCGIDNIEYALRLGSANAASVVEHIGTKEGILTKSSFEKSKRWQRLPIKIVKLK